MKRLCTICVRGGSRGVRNKNKLILHGKSLIQHSIDQALESKLFDHIALSSDDDTLLEIASNSGVDFTVKRPIELATDTAPKLPAIQHCAIEAEKQSKVKYDVFVDLDVTSPLRLPLDIQNAVSMLEVRRLLNVMTGCKARRSPYFNMVEIDENGVVKICKKLSNAIFRRQDSPTCYDLNASIYVWSREGLLQEDTLFLENTALYEMPFERSIDIDTLDDIEMVDFLMTKKNILEKSEA